MEFERFLKNGNKIGVFGSFVYLPEGATDLDFTLFTVDGDLPFYSSPEYSDEVICFFESKFKTDGLKLDFSGRRDRLEKLPYDLSNLPKRDIWLMGYLLTGIFYPDGDFLDDHYRGIYGDDFLEKSWLEYSAYVQRFPLQGARLNKRHKDIALMMKATERLADCCYPKLKNLIEIYQNKYFELNELCEMEKLNVFDYDRQTAAMVPEFINAVKTFYLS